MSLRLALVVLLAATPALADPHPQASRVLSIGGSVTEIVYALGQQDRLIGRDTTSTYPAEAQALPMSAISARFRPRGCCRSVPT